VFKVDLIEECNTIDPKDHVSVTEPPKLFDITLNVSKSHRSFIERNSSVISASKDLGESFEVHIQISNLEWLRRSILSNAPGIAISSPSSLADEVLESANSVLALYQA
jgi:predicted DNA-binding transcriptional regulator YafY